MSQRTQDTVVRVVIGVIVLWVGWDAVRAAVGTLLALLAAPPSERTVSATVFLLAYGLVPALAMAGCAMLAGGLIAKYPSRNQARSLALLTVSVGLVFGQLFLPTLVAALETFDVQLVPGGESLGGGVDLVVFGLVVALSPAWLFWFSACFPDMPHRIDSGRSVLATLIRVQGVAFRTPAVLLLGLLPYGVAVVSNGGGLMPVVGLITLGVGLASLWLTHLTVSEPVLGRTAVVMIALSMLAIPIVLWPLADLLPQYSRFFFDILVLGTGGALCAMVLGLAYAVFVQGAVGPALVLKRGLWLGGGGAVLVFMFAGLENSLADLVVERAGLPGSLGTFVSAGVMAVLITSLRHRLGRKRERRPAP